MREYIFNNSELKWIELRKLIYEKGEFITSFTIDFTMMGADKDILKISYLFPIINYQKRKSSGSKVPKFYVKIITERADAEALSKEYYRVWSFLSLIIDPQIIFLDSKGAKPSYRKTNY